MNGHAWTRRRARRIVSDALRRAADCEEIAVVLSHATHKAVKQKPSIYKWALSQLKACATICDAKRANRPKFG